MSRLTLTTSQMIPELLGRAFLAGLTPTEIFFVKNRVDRTETGIYFTNKYSKFYLKFNEYVRSLFTSAELEDLYRARISSVSTINYHIRKQVGENVYKSLIVRGKKIGPAKVGFWYNEKKKKEAKVVKVKDDVWKHFTTVNYSPNVLVKA